MIKIPATSSLDDIAAILDEQAMALRLAASDWQPGTPMDRMADSTATAQEQSA